MNSHHQPAEWAKTRNILENGYFGVYGFTDHSHAQVILLKDLN